MKAQSIMTSNVFCVGSEKSLRDAAKLMWEHNCGSIPVVGEGNRLVSMITDRDIAMAAYLNGAPLETIPLSVAQSKQLVSCKPDDDIKDVQQMMQTYQKHRIPVVNKEGEPVGIISLNDIACALEAGVKGLKAQDISSTLAAICGSIKKFNTPSSSTKKPRTAYIGE